MINSVSSSSYDRTAMTSQIAQKMFKKIDSNSDGGVDKSELEAIAGSGSTTDVSQLFSKIDTNSDGIIDESENESALQKLAQKMESAFSGMNGAGRKKEPPPPPDASEMFSKLDTDNSGGISEDEFDAISKTGDGNMPQFSDIDSDGDGSISKAENEEFMKSMGPPPGPPPGGMGGDGGMGQMGGVQGTSNSDSFADLLSALESAVSDDEEDETSSSIQQLFNELKSNIKYSAQGSKSYSMSGTDSLFSITA
ncbi:MAG: EF-hand domain-containing protein [Fibrobacterota bacterium]|nr:EF-hand domain-containing protein [Chitinispirillaceae bacterium]